MELRRLSIYLALFVFVCVSQCTEARNTKYSGEANDVNYDDVLADEASEDEAQNDADGGNDADEDMVEDAVILTQATNYSVVIGRTVRLECKVSPADGVVVQWTRNNTKYFIGTLKKTEQDLKTYTGQDRFFIAANSTDLLIKDVQPDDSGTYRCEILQLNPPSVEHNIVITESPKVMRFYASDNGRVAEGNDLLLTCEASGSPPPQILWSWDGGDNGNHRLTEKDGEFTANSVFIRGIKRQNAGKYYCYVFNTVGNDQAELAVEVLRKPRVHVHRTVVNSDLNVEAVLECSIHDEPASHIRWYKDGRLIEDSSRQYSVSTNGQHSNLTVVPTSDLDFGTFTCEAENNLGKHNRSIELVQRPVVEDFANDGPRLSWTVHSHQPLQAIELQIRDMNGEEEWKSISVPLPEGRHHEYTFAYSLDEADIDAGRYEVTVKVQNDKSWSEHSSPAVVDIEAQPQYIRPASVYLPGSAFSIRPSLALLPCIFVLVRF